MFGSDWPVANLRGGYSKVWRETNLVLAGISPDERDCILGGTAIEFYRLPVTDPAPIEIAFGAGRQDMELKAQRLGCRL